jgi:protoporphyrinogen oxidase
LSEPHGTNNTGPAVVIGAGPAGLTAAWELVKRQVPVTVLEKYRLPGGIARTEQYNGYYFDIGGHRFFTKLAEINRLWHDWLPDDFITRPRKSRIFYNGHFFDYPLRIGNTLSGLGMMESVRIALSYGQSRLFPYSQENNLEEWVSNRFGKRLYSIFFKTYTEKVWGIPCTEIRAEWAAQRIKGLSLTTAVKNALLPQGRGKIKTLIESFEYPRHGPGQMWQRVVELLRERGQQVLMNAEALEIRHNNGWVTGVVYGHPDGTRLLPANTVISSMPLPEMIIKLNPPAPLDILETAKKLTYRDFLTVILIFDQPHLFADNWLYIHSPDVKVGRIQNFKNWSSDMVPDPDTTSLGLEYFCTEGDTLWNMTDTQLIELGKREIEQIGLAGTGRVIDATVVRQPKAYPVYDTEYAGYLATLKQYLSRFENLQTIGRNGLHKYNNQDHSMLTAVLAVQNVFGARHNLWNVNTERSYHEEVRGRQNKTG